jgi:hypothetical protein
MTNVEVQGELPPSYTERADFGNGKADLPK